MIAPSYNDIPSNKIPEVNIEHGKVRVISGSYKDIKGPGLPHTGMYYFDVELNQSENINIPLDDYWNSFIYVYSGEASVGGQRVRQGQLAILSEKGALNFISNGTSVLKCIVVSGDPINEPVARGGPFVMNTKAEVLQAFNDYQNGVLVK